MTNYEVYKWNVLFKMDRMIQNEKFDFKHVNFSQPVFEHFEAGKKCYLRDVEITIGCLIEENDLDIFRYFIPILRTHGVKTFVNEQRDSCNIALEFILSGVHFEKFTDNFEQALLYVMMLFNNID